MKQRERGQPRRIVGCSKWEPQAEQRTRSASARAMWRRLCAASDKSGGSSPPADAAPSRSGVSPASADTDGVVIRLDADMSAPLRELVALKFWKLSVGDD